MNPYAAFVAELAAQMERARQFPLGGFAMPDHPRPAADAPRALIFSPHPDDEVIIGGLALRLQRELKWNVINVAVTQGSNKARQPERWKELQQCCDYVGFGLLATREGGLEGVNPKTRAGKPADWAEKVGCIARILREHKPSAIFFPHDDDWNVTHIGTHHLVVDALGTLGPGFSCLTVETEFWGAMDTPNMMVESSARDVADLITALTFHVGEVRRNPYHLRTTAWMMDNVRRGGELVGGQGKAAPDFTFATLYRLRRWANGGFLSVLDRGRFLSAKDDLKSWFPSERL